MTKFIAMLRDSLKEAVDGWIFLVMLGLSGLLILLVGSLSVKPLPADSAMPLLISPEAIMLSFADRGQSNRAALYLLSCDFKDITTLTSGSSPWECEVRLKLSFSRIWAPGMGGGMEFEDGKNVKDMKNPEDLKDLKMKKVEGTAGIFSDPLEDPVRYWAAPAGTPAKERPEFTEALACEYLAHQIHAASGLEVLKVERKGRGEYEVTVRSESRLRWPHEPSILFGALKLGFLRGGLGDIVYKLESYLVSGLGAWITVLAGVVVTAGFIPNMLHKGAIDLLLTKPMSRPLILIYKYLGGLSFVAILTGVTAIGTWTAIGVRTGVWAPGLLVAVLAITFYFAILYAFSTLVAVLTRNSIVCIVMTCGLWGLLFVIGVFHFFVLSLDRIEDKRFEAPSTAQGKNEKAGPPMPDLKPPEWLVTATTTLNRITPRMRDLDNLTDRVIGAGLLSEGEQDQQRKKMSEVDWPEVIGVSLAYIALFLGIAVLRFVTRSY